MENEDTGLRRKKKDGREDEEWRRKMKGCEGGRRVEKEVEGLIRKMKG